MNYHLIIARYLPWTNSLPGRVKISSPRFKESITFTAGSVGGQDPLTEAELYLRGRGFNIVGHCEVDDGVGGLISDTFKSIKSEI